MAEEDLQLSDIDVDYSDFPDVVKMYKQTDTYFVRDISEKFDTYEKEIRRVVRWILINEPEKYPELEMRSPGDYPHKETKLSKHQQRDLIDTVKERIMMYPGETEENTGYSGNLNWIMDNYQLSRRQAKVYVKRANKELKSEVSVDAEKKIQSLENLSWEVLRESKQEGKLSTTLRAIKHLTKVLDGFPDDKHQHKVESDTPLFQIPEREDLNDDIEEDES